MTSRSLGHTDTMRRLLSLSVLAGCSHQVPLAQVHELAGEGEVEVRTTSGESIDAVPIAAPGGVTFIPRTGGTLPADAIAEVRDVRHLRGAVEGLGLGALIGAGTGAVLGYAEGDDQCTGECFLAFSAETKAILGAIVVGGLGAGVGLVIGALKGSTIIYSNESSGIAVRPIAPPGSVAGLTVTF